MSVKKCEKPVNQKARDTDFYSDPNAQQGRQVRNISADINIQGIDQFLLGLPNIAPVRLQETPQYTLLYSRQ